LSGGDWIRLASVLSGTETASSPSPGRHRWRRGVSIVNLYVAPGGPRPANLAELAAQRQSHLPRGRTLPLERAAEALRAAAALSLS
jgi:hypothetical protein